MTLNTQKGIADRIARLVALAVFLAVMAAALAQTALQTLSAIDSRKNSMEATAFALASSAGEAVKDRDRARALSSLSAISRVPDVLVASVRMRDGTTLAALGQSAYLENDVVLSSDSKLALLWKGQLPISVDIIKGGVARGELRILGDISDLRGQVLLSVFATFAAALVAALLGVLASKPLQRRVVQPIAGLTNTIQSIRNSRDYSARIDDNDVRDEPAILVNAFNGLMSDIQFRDQALQHLAYNDPLTGLANRVSFQRTIEEWLASNQIDQSGAVALLNVHGFRALNDAFSHSIGDALLMTVAAQIKSAIREDVTVARYGGDEYALLFRNARSEADVEIALARINTVFHKPLQIGELELHVSLMAGAVLIGGKADTRPDADEILRHADLALEEAKRYIAGRVQFFRPQLSEQVQQDTALGQALRQAAKAGQFDLHYQAQMDLQTTKIVGFEVLARWTHPDKGPISPAVFIPLAERNGLVSIIGDWVLAEGCRQAAHWHRKGGPECVISVNVSPAQMLTAGFIEKVRGALQKSGLPPRLLCLELTESIFVGANYAETVMVLETLAKDGVRLALDDFGTGYSSLSYLSKLPFHDIKIDRAFVSKVDRDAKKRGMLRSIVDMVHAAGMGVVAEGAETAEEISVLREMGVECVQGYAVAKPLPLADARRLADDVDARLKRQTA
jgi:diguanylate cyclase (GGDEF)-like protein